MKAIHQNISYKNILRIAYPVMVGGIAQNVVNVTDTAFLGRLGEVAIGAAGNGGLLYMAFFMLSFGFAMGMQVIIGRRNGEKNYTQIGAVMDQSIYFLMSISLGLFLFMKFVTPLLLSHVTQSQAIYDSCNEYMNYRSWGIFFSMFNSVFRGLYIGITKTQVLTWTTIIMAIVNVFFDYCLIFGHWGFPEMGVGGAALASVIAEIVTTVCFVVYTYSKIDVSTYHLFSFSKFNIGLLRSILKVALPTMFLYFFALVSWYAFFLIIEQIGERELAISHIVRSIHSVLQIPLFGLGAATVTLASNIIGQGHRDLVMGLIKKILILGIASAFIILQTIIFIPKWMISIYTNNPELIQETLPVMYIIGISIFTFSAAHILFSGVTGTGNSRMAFLIEVGAIVVYITTAYVLALVVRVAIPYVWYSELVYAIVLGTLAYLYLKRGRWREVNV